MLKTNRTSREKKTKKKLLNTNIKPVSKHKFAQLQSSIALNTSHVRENIHSMIPANTGSSSKVELE